MPYCIYCEKTVKKLTREHVFPNFINKRRPDGLYFNGAIDKYLKSEPVTKDVCETCNNILLGRLDKYGASLFDKYFKNEITEITILNGDIEMLMRWVLKVIFNGQRAFDCPDRIFYPYKKFMLGKQKSPREILLLGSVVTGSQFNGKHVPPTDIRISDIRLSEKNLNVQFSLCHQFTVGSYSFSVISFLDRITERKKANVLKFLKKHLGALPANTNTGQLCFNPALSKIDYITNKNSQRYINPAIYPKDGLIKAGKGTVKLQYFKESSYPTKPSKIDNKISLISFDANGLLYPILGLKNFPKNLCEFQANISENVFDYPISKIGSATVERRGQKTYLTLNDASDKKFPILYPTQGIHQTKENWELFKRGLNRHNKLLLAKVGPTSQIKDDLDILSMFEVRNIKEVDIQ